MIDRSMYKKELMRLRHDVDNPNKDGRRKGLPYAKVWPAGTVFQVEDRRADIIQREMWKCEALGVEFDPVAARRKAFESQPRGALRLKIGDRFWEVGHYDLEFDDDFDRHLEQHPLSKLDKIDHNTPLSVTWYMPACRAQLPPINASIPIVQLTIRTGIARIIVVICPGTLLGVDGVLPLSV